MTSDQVAETHCQLVGDTEEAGLELLEIVPQPDSPRSTWGRNCIEDIVTPPDLPDRAMLLTLEPIPEESPLVRCRGGAVRLAAPGNTLMIGEGIKTCLADMQATGHPTWAALSRSGLRTLELALDVRDAIVLANGDDPGEAAARKCAWRLVVAWALAVLRDCGPYSVIVLSREQGSAKSTFSGILRALLEPNTAPPRALPREDRDLFITASNGHMLAFDNVSGLPAWISDTLCQLATGGGFAVRQLYTDRDEVS